MRRGCTEKEVLINRNLQTEMSCRMTKAEGEASRPLVLDSVQWTMYEDRIQLSNLGKF